MYVVSRNPLKLVLHIGAADNYSARFSADSKTITLVAWSLMAGTWRLSDGERLNQKLLPIKDGCIDAEISPDGRNLACRRTDFSLALYNISTGEQAFADTVHKLPSDPVRTHVNEFRSIFTLTLDTRSAFAHPFGYYLTRDPRLLTNRGSHRSPIVFSADGRQLLTDTPFSEHIRMESSGKKIGLPGSVEKRLKGNYAFLGTDRLLVVERDKPNEPLIVSLESGAVLAKPAFEADGAWPATNQRYVMLYSMERTGAGLFDLKNNQSVDVPPNLELDVYGEEMAVLTEEGNLILERLGEKQSQKTIRLPLVQTAQLRTAIVDQGLETMVLAVDGQSTVFHLANGNRLAQVPKFFAANLLDAKSAILLSRQKNETRALRLDITAGTSAEAWAASKQILYAGGTVFLEYSIPRETFGVVPFGVIEPGPDGGDPVSSACSRPGHWE